jgi:hypothetical protein
MATGLLLSVLLMISVPERSMPRAELNSKLAASRT